MKQSDLLFWIWLAEALGAANPDFRYINQTFETPFDVFQTEEDELKSLNELSPNTVRALSDKNLDNASSILDSCERLGIGIVIFPSPLYPQLLREIKNPPVLLYYAGSFPNFEKHLSIGMVGTRRMSVYGMETAYKISYELAKSDTIIISGLAAGIDGVSSAAALKAGGTTVAVLGCGLDVVYPANHGLLMKEIGEKGLLLSEYPPGAKPVYYHFPVRNRIISGLSNGVVVVEAGVGSGSLITAKEAVSQGRDVFAIPATDDGIGADGANGLLRDGAVFAIGSEDILKKYQYLFLEGLRPEVRKRATEHSDADWEYLKRIGVIKMNFGKKKSKAEVQPQETDHAAGTQIDTQISETADQKAGYRPQMQTAEPMGLPEKLRPAAEKIQQKREAEPLRPAAKIQKNRPPKKQIAEKNSEPQSQQKKETADALLQSLSPVQLAVLKAMPDDQAVTVDALLKYGYSTGEVITALTVLEIMGLVQKLPGALYTKV